MVSRSEDFELDQVQVDEREDDELPKYYACSDMLALPSKDRSEGFALTPNDLKSLADGLRKALKDDQLLKRMGKNERVFAEQHDWSIVAQQTENLYRRTLAAR